MPFVDTKITSLQNSGHSQFSHGSIRQSGMYKNPEKILGYQGLGMPTGKWKAEELHPSICFGSRVIQLSRRWKSADMQEKTPGKSFAAAQICSWDLQAPEASRKFKGIKLKPTYPVFCQNSQTAPTLPAKPPASHQLL